MREPAIGKRMMRRPSATGPRHRLICFHHAGAGAAAFASWIGLVPSDVELVAIRMPGRELRVGEDARSDPRDAVADCVETLRALVYDGVPSAYFGHSMGGVIAYETHRALAAEGAPAPLFLAVSATPAPQCQAARPRRLPDAYDSSTLEGLLQRFGGTDPEVLADPELLDLVLPAFESDLLLLDRYRAQLPPEPVRCPLIVFAGRDDPWVRVEEVTAWRECALGGYREIVLPAAHAYIESHGPEVLAELAAAASAARNGII